MTTKRSVRPIDSRELMALNAGFWLAGVTVTVTAASYLLNMTFSIQVPVWIIGAAFGAVALVSHCVCSAPVIAVGNPMFGFPWAGVCVKKRASDGDSVQAGKS